MITIYQYVANNNPSEAVAICNKYGYGIPDNADWQDVAKCLEDLVEQDGAAPLYDILSYHPDKEIILEVNQQEQKSSEQSPGKKCSCHDKSKVDEYVNAANNNSVFQSHQGNILIMAATLLAIVAVVVVSSNNK